MTNDQPEEKAPTTRLSSAFVRVVGNTRIEVVNTKQRPDETTARARSKKWAVMTFTGESAKKAFLYGSDKKYDAIEYLKLHELKLKAAAANADD